MDTAAAAGAFCERLRPKLIGTLSLHCGDRDVAEELTQETLARVWDRWDKVSTYDNPEAWAYRVGINLTTSWYRRRAAERRAKDRNNNRAVLIVIDEPEDPLAREAIRAGVAALPERQRTALVLRYFSDLSVDETASIMGCATGTVKSLTHRAIAGLRQDPTIAVFDEPRAEHEEVR